MKVERKFRTFISLCFEFLSYLTFNGQKLGAFTIVVIRSLFPSSAFLQLVSFVLILSLCPEFYASDFNLQILTGKVLVFGGGLAVIGVTCLLLYPSFDGGLICLDLILLISMRLRSL
ncbi:hypothetical protein QL285_086793 [Trifolium repens]|nr:hypothetical protein QL285_086793 [Trifolium repens]